LDVEDKPHGLSAPPPDLISIAVFLWEYAKEYTAFTQSLLGLQRTCSKISGRYATVSPCISITVI
jgi:hypothetical protein